MTDTEMQEKLSRALELLELAEEQHCVCDKEESYCGACSDSSGAIERIESVINALFERTP